MAICRPFGKILPLSLTLLLSWSCASLTSEQAAFWARGLEAEKKEEWTAAVKALTELLRQRPGFAPARFHRGICLFYAARDAEAAEELEEVVRSGNLNESELHKALYCLARARIELARKDDRDSGSRRSSQLSGESRQLFRQALEDLKRALEIRVTYDVLLWKGYCLQRLDFFEEAFEAFQECESMHPGRLEHILFKAMALYRLSPVNENSLAAYLQLLRRDHSRSLHLLYERLAAVYDGLSPNLQRRVFVALEEYVRRHREPDPRTRRVVRKVRRKIEGRLLEERIYELTQRARSLRDRRDYEEALQLLSESSAGTQMERELEALKIELQEELSAQLEEDAETNLSSEDRQKWLEALKMLQRAQELTTRIERKIVLRQKIDALQVLLQKVRGVTKLEEAQKILRKGRYREALDILNRIPLQSLQEHEKDLYYYFRGLALYHLGEWSSAVSFFKKVRTDHFGNLLLLTSVALWHSGRKEEAFKILIKIPLSERPPEALRILGHHLLSQGKYTASIENLEKISVPTTDDLNALQKAYALRGAEAGRRGDWNKAIEDLRKARQIIESKLYQRGIEVYLNLGRAYWAIQDFDRAEKTFQDLLNIGLTEAERKKCRDAYLYRGLLHYRKNDLKRALEDLREFLYLGGVLPPAARKTYRRILEELNE